MQANTHLCLSGRQKILSTCAIWNYSLVLKQYSLDFKHMCLSAQYIKDMLYQSSLLKIFSSFRVLHQRQQKSIVNPVRASPTTTPTTNPAIPSSTMTSRLYHHTVLKLNLVVKNESKTPTQDTGL